MLQRFQACPGQARACWLIIFTNCVCVCINVFTSTLVPLAILDNCFKLISSSLAKYNSCYQNKRGQKEKKNPQKQGHKQGHHLLPVLCCRHFVHAFIHLIEYYPEKPQLFPANNGPAKLQVHHAGGGIASADESWWGWKFLISSLKLIPCAGSSWFG